MIEIRRTFNRDRGFKLVEPLNGYTFTPETNAHTFFIECVDKVNGLETVVPFEAGSTVSARFLKTDHVTELVEGSLNTDGAAVVTLPSECYSVPGRFLLTILVTTGSTTICVYAATGTVIAADSSTVNVSENASREIDEKIAELNAAAAQVNSAISAGSAKITEINQAAAAARASIPQDYTALSDSVGDLKSAVINGGYLIEKSDIVQGSYDGNGNITTNSKRIRPAQFIPVTNGGTVHFAPGDNVKEIFYGKFNTNKTFLGDGPSWFSSDFTTNWDGYMICVYRNGTNTDLAPADYDAITLVMTAKEYENYNKSKEQDLFFEAAEDTLDIKNYTNIVTPIFTPLTVSSQNNATISNIVNVESGKTYFGYALVNITNLTGYTTGNMYLRAWDSLAFTLDGKSAGNSNQPIANGEIELYGEFTPTSSGNVKMMLYHANSGNSYTYNVTVEKLYLIEGTSEALKTIRSKEYSNDLVTSELYDDSVGLEKLSPEVRSIIGESDTNVIDCWGDSLTAGAGGSGTTYPSKLQELIGETFTVNNYGQGSEAAESIAFRQGGLDGIVKPFTASTSYVTVPALQSVDGSSLGTLNFQGTYYGNNIVSIDGINYFYRRVSETECKLARISGSSNPTYTRPMLVTAEGKGTKHIIIICVGQNGWVNSDSETLANIIQSMIDHNGYDKYLVLGIPAGNYESKHEQEAILGSRFGNHFVNTREYISAYGFADNPTVTPDPTDEQEMAAGAIPHSLRDDNVHLNSYGYIAMANCVYARGVSLGYWD